MKNFIKHDDKRRTLYDYASGNFKSAKVVVAKEAIPVGDHYHKKKDEIFFLLQGNFIELIVGEDVRRNIPAPYIVVVKRGVYHKFILEPGSILCGVATEEFDINDELK